MKKSESQAKYRLVAELLQEKRLAAGLRQQDLAERLREPQSYVSKVESGGRRVDLVQLHRYCNALGVSLKSFVGEYLKRAEKSGSK